MADPEIAQEIAQEVWLRVIRGIGRLRDGAKWRAWLFGIARRVLMDRLRAQYAMRARHRLQSAAFGSKPITRVRALMMPTPCGERSDTWRSRCGNAATDRISRWRCCDSIPTRLSV
jgi:DNA-directed RNA polymerase specialized sigma24 family protein